MLPTFMLTMLPTFMLIGAEKCGTTSLYHYLRQHPSVFMCTPKEPEYFSGNGIRTREAYEALFAEAAGKKAVGEASVGYLHNTHAPARIKKALPDVRLFAVLRDPAERAYSHYNMLVSAGAVPNRPYLDVLTEARRTGNYRYTGLPTSRYADALQRYYDLFDGDHLRIYLYENYRRDPAGMMHSIFEYVGVNPDYRPDTARRHNETFAPRNDLLHRLIQGKSSVKAAARRVLPDPIRDRLARLLHRTNRAPVPPLEEEARRLIYGMLRDDIERTEELIDRNLSNWKPAADESS